MFLLFAWPTTHCKLDWKNYKGFDLSQPVFPKIVVQIVKYLDENNGW